MADEKKVRVKQTNFGNQFNGDYGYGDYRATVGSLKKALECFDDDLPIGVNYDDGYGYCDINEIIIEEGLVRLIG